jgi:peptide/nickel transport system substrate-binding protein
MHKIRNIGKTLRLAQWLVQRKNVMKRVVLPLLILLAVLPVAVWAQSADTIVIRGFGNISNFNPHLSNDGASYQAFSLLWPAPFLTDSFTGAAVPGLTSWTISEDGLTYTFTIREDAQWSDGTPITSDDMIFSIGVIMSDDVDTVLESNVSSIDHVSRVDDRTYEVVLKNVDCSTLSNLSGIRFLPAHRFAADFSDFSTNDITNNPDISGGPYILDSWAPDEGQSFHANPNYWAGEPNIPFLANKVIGDQAVAVQAIQSGEVDYTYFQGDLFQQIEDKSNLQYQSFPALSVNFLSLNWADPTNPQPAYDASGNPVEETPHPLFSDPAVRQAVVMGFNIDDVLVTLGGSDGGTPLVGVVAPTIGWAYDNELQRYPYDPEAAAQLLEDAGWVDSDGDGVREKDGVLLAFTIRYSNILQHFETTALVAQDQLNQIGFNVDVELVEWANYLTDVYYGQMYDATPMSNSGGTNTPDPNDFTTLLMSTEDVPGSGNNLASYVNPEVDALIEQARAVPDCSPEARAALYYQVQEIAHNDIAYNWTYVPNIFQVANNRVGNFNPGPAWVFYGYTAYIHEWTLEG